MLQRLRLLRNQQVLPLDITVCKHSNVTEFQAWKKEEEQSSNPCMFSIVQVGCTVLTEKRITIVIVLDNLKAEEMH